MNYLGIDYGEKRIGLSYGDELGLAFPMDALVDKEKSVRFDKIEEIIKTRRIGALVVGYPFNMNGTVGFKAKEVDVFVKELEERFSLPVYRVDERLTSQHAENQMKVSTKNKKNQSIKARQALRKQGVVDSRAATLILQDFLDGAAPAAPGLDALD